jgi:ribose transport system ATP-binding protein
VAQPQVTEGQRSERRADQPPLLEVRNAHKRFGSTQALAGASITVALGELVGIAGHNGAGKSTLLRSIAGYTPFDSGEMRLGGEVIGTGTRTARRWGVRSVHQEQSLCPSLRVDETAAVADRSLGGLRWRSRAASRMTEALDDIFPGHGIEGHQRIADLPVAQRQMVEIATVALEGDGPPRLLLLDEPTSSLDSDATAKLYRWLHRAAGDGMGVVITTHRLQEMLDHLDRLYVMRDGKILAERTTDGLQRHELVELMGGSLERPDPPAPRADPGRPTGPDATLSDQPERERTVSERSAPEPCAARVVIAGLRTAGLDDVSLEVYPGELVGLAGLEGHGQRRLLEVVFAAAQRHGRGRRSAVQLNGTVAYVSGDRAVQGVFRFWDLGHNISVSSMGRLSRLGVLVGRREKALIGDWTRRLAIRGDARQPITALSGGNQQKVLVARAVATEADVLLLDDPTRGVDQATKEQIYGMLRTQADEGRSVVWYSTENEELLRCDRLCMLHQGHLVRTLSGEEVTEEQLIGSSFGEAGRQS